MPLKFVEIKKLTIPQAWIPPSNWNPDILETIHQKMRKYSGKDDLKNDWRKNYKGDCQGRVSAALEDLYNLGVPLSSMAGYVGWAIINKKKVYEAHAILVIHYWHTARNNKEETGERFSVLDSARNNVISLEWGIKQGLYRHMIPAMKGVVE